MAYQLYSCAKAIYFLQSGHTSGMHMRIFKKDRLGSLTPKKKTTLLLLNHISIKTKAKKKTGLRLCQISALSTLSICKYR